MLPALLFLLRITFLFGVFCCSMYIFDFFFFYFCENFPWDFDRDYIVSVDCFR